MNASTWLEEVFLPHLRGIFTDLPAKEGLLYATADGKRLRPLLLWTMAQALVEGPLSGEEEAACLDFATAIELIHSYSLVHDDLPAMDNDFFRRGKPSVHAKFGEAQAILLGDALLNLAFEVLAKSLAASSGSLLLRKARAMEEMATFSGIQGMIHGQMLDMENVSRKSLVRQMVEEKTGALFRGACRAAACLVGAREEELQRADAFALNYGLLFQLLDDLHDSKEDAELGKLSYFHLLGPKEGQEAIRYYAAAAQEIASHFAQGEKLDYFFEKLSFGKGVL